MGEQFFRPKTAALLAEYFWVVAMIYAVIFMVDGIYQAATFNRLNLKLKKLSKEANGRNLNESPEPEA